ncbi:hypothetical protein GWK47_043757 [Chionoecetes opilio]|uniref:Uncharacterized protein n=1 Tax=Chionoecetes opilio TaxID=41210 RepID=A0A8J5CZH2_CHIOP|nr:hypothetical protein GWK47_043757 [Chionoecetes opilio]
MRTEKQQDGTNTYIIESETSREEEHVIGKQRKVRNMSQELHIGGNLEIARSPDKQLAIMMSHPQEGASVYMSEESLHLSRTPPTPGKHLFIPPPPVLASSLSNSSSSSISSYAQARQDRVNLPLKKRKGIISMSDKPGGAGLWRGCCVITPVLPTVGQKFV